MTSPSHLACSPALLPPGTVVGTWRVQAWAGCGVHGAVYRAVPLLRPLAAPVALKLALHPGDPRFAREAELLSRCLHPSIPCLLDQGSWRSPSGALHPFLVMQWVDGLSLYDQARLHPPAPTQVRRWLAQVAQALAVLHAQGALHRDLKGDNIRVSYADGRAMLLDFGTGLYPGAAPLTPALAFPGTPVYRSPESWLFEVRNYGSSTARYAPSAADDLYALGVTACRLLSDEYPQPPEPFRDEHGTWHLRDLPLPPTLLRHPHVDPSLRAITLRLLSVHPEQRGTAAQLAEELEQTLRPFRSGRSRHLTETTRMRALPWPDWRWVAVAAAGMAAAVWGWWSLPGKPLEETAVAQVQHSEAASADVGTAGLGDAATTVASELPPSAATEEAMSASPLPQPVPGQVRTDEKGRCPRKGLVALNGACWAETTGDPEVCQTLGGQLFKDTCYLPFIPPERRHPPTSGPKQNP
ncbi:serine/threonine-protein kinase [Hyalangium gracile]|uniref:serine/threonine-protein kinase n=1 Tax=Hyalangium gracile TaxID=394092 RepID=UPI001CD01680|nr:serine/threonine-protein kinase [Hyalangium gracile]